MVRMVDTSKLFQRASEAVDKDNYDYAIELFLEILKTNPDDLKARMALRQTQKSKFDKKGSGAGTAISAAITGIGNVIGALFARLFKKYDTAILQYEKYLTRNPFSPWALTGLATALSKSGRGDPAIVVLEFLKQVKPSHIKTLRRLAHIYEERNDITRALQRYQMILKYKPSDIEASKQMHNLSATESIQEGWDNTETFQDKIRDREQAAKLEQSQHYVRTASEAVDAIDRLKLEIEERPDSPVLWAELGDLQRRKDDYRAAEEAYEKALELDPKNQLYLQKLMDTKLREFTKRVEQAREASQAAPEDETLKRAVERIETEKNEFWLNELKRRAEARPTDTGLRYDLGLAYFGNGLINEATAEFQRVVRDPKLRVSATAMLGNCFAKKGLDELAIEQFERALEESSLMEESGKEIAYNLGITYERVGNLEEAEGAYKKIFEIDIGFRDIAEKMEEVYKMRRAKKSPSNPEEN